MPLRFLGVMVLLGALWGSSFLFIKIAVAELPPDLLVAGRLSIASVILLAILYGRGMRMPRDLRMWGNFFFAGTVGLVVPFVLITWGEQSISSSMAGILNATTPLFTALLTALWLREEQLRGWRLVGVLVGFVGVVVAIGVDQISIGNTSFLGQIAVLVAAFCYGIHSNFSRRAFKGLPSLVPATGQLVTGALVITPIALIRNGLPHQISPAAGGAVLMLAVFGTSFAYILLYWLIANAGATRASMVTYLVAPFALVYGALLLGETIHLNAVLGLGLVVLGIVLSSGIIKRRPAPPYATEGKLP